MAHCVKSFLTETHLFYVFMAVQKSLPIATGKNVHIFFENQFIVPRKVKRLPHQTIWGAQRLISEAEKVDIQQIFLV